MTRLQLLSLRSRPIAIALLTCISASAMAEEPQSPAGNNGAMVFPNVKVISAQDAAAATQATGTAGMRVQKDRTTGKLRAPTGEEVAELDATAPPEPEAKVEVRTSASGVKSAKLNEAFMSYSLVHKDASGTLTEQCVTGETAAAQEAHRAAGTEEVSHER